VRHGASRTSRVATSDSGGSRSRRWGTCSTPTRSQRPSRARARQASPSSTDVSPGTGPSSRTSEAGGRATPCPIRATSSSCGPQRPSWRTWRTRCPPDDAFARADAGLPDPFTPTQRAEAIRA